VDQGPLHRRRPPPVTSSPRCSPRATCLSQRRPCWHGM
jgi:hypothetical protein